MESTGPKHRLSKLRIAFVFALATIAAGAVSYGYHLYRLAQDLQINKPQPQVERLARDLRRYYAETRRFPANFSEINQLLWRTKPEPDYGSDGRRAWTKNYYYFYTKANDETCAFWALPIGSRRQYASSFFVVLSPDWMRAWKGEAMSDEEITVIPVIPSPVVLSELKMREVPAHVFSANR
ncbi:MAG: hypothetical protein ACREXT_17900 [Gammaproteobacteria bacterium]